MYKYNLIFDGDSILFGSNDFNEFRYDLENYLEMNTDLDIITLRSFDFERLKNIIIHDLYGEIKIF